MPAMFWLSRALAVLMMLAAPPAQAADEWTRLDQAATAQYRGGDYAGALSSAQQALAVAEREPASARLATSLNALALIHQAQGENAQAQVLLERALAVSEAVLPGAHPNLAALRSNLDSVQQAQRQHEVATAVRRAEALNERALAHHGRGEVGQAAALYEQALPILETHYGPDSVEVARVLANLADACATRKPYPQAEALYQRALGIYEGRDGEAAAQAGALNALAAVYYTQRQYGKAEPLFQRSLAVLEAARGPEHVDLLPALDNLAALYLTTRRDERAEVFRRRAAAIRKAAPGSSTQ